MSAYATRIELARRAIVQSALEEADGNVSAAARDLGIPPSYLHRLVNQLRLRAWLHARRGDRR